tara:strand:- start:200 stop:697 length:498 start_codon:yes stop_codon:yes gene_type:complete
MKIILTPNPAPPHNLQRIVYNPDWLAGMTEDDIIVRVVARNREAGLIRDDYWVVDEADLPGGAISVENDYNYFFDAWEWLGDGCKVNMPKARVIHMGRIRLQRDAALEALDVPFMRAVETGDAAEQQRIAAAKQQLRDIPQTLDLDGCATPEALGAVWPDGLARP